MNSRSIRQHRLCLSGDAHHTGFSMCIWGERNGWTQRGAGPNVHIPCRASRTLRTRPPGFAHCTIARNRVTEKRGASIERFTCSRFFADCNAGVHGSDFQVADARAGLSLPSNPTRRMRQPSRETKCRIQRVHRPSAAVPPLRGSLSPRICKRKRPRPITVVGRCVFVFLDRSS